MTVLWTFSVWMSPIIIIKHIIARFQPRAQQRDKIQLAFMIFNHKAQLVHKKKQLPHIHEIDKTLFVNKLNRRIRTMESPDSGN